MYTGFWWGNPKKRDQLGDPGVDGRIICEIDLQELGCGGMELIELAQDMDRWRTLMNAVMSVRYLHEKKIQKKNKHMFRS